MRTIAHFFSQNTKKILLGCILGLILSQMMHVGVFAESTQVMSKEQSDKIIKGLNGFLSAAGAILGVVTAFISIFLYPGWVNGTFFGLQDYLKEIWILVSNVVYFIFAMILIVIAFMNIIGKGENTWELKQALPKFIVGVLIVPFTWFLVQFILSISSVLTVGVLTLPYDVFSGKELFDKSLNDTEKKYCNDIIISLAADAAQDSSGVAIDGLDPELSQIIRCRSENSKSTLKEVLSGTNSNGDNNGINNSIYGIISIYTYGILSLQNLDTINSADLTTIKGVADLILKIVFDLLFVVIYLLLMVALFLALLVRGIRLWLFMMLSPLFGLFYFFGKVKDGAGEDTAKFNPMEFIKLALVPVYVAAALSFGLVFIMVASNGLAAQAENKDLSQIKAGGFTISVVGSHADSSSDGSQASGEKSPLAKLVVQLFGVVILWIAVMAALRSSETTKAIVEPIHAFGKSVGELASKAPTYAPIIPMGPGKQMQSAASLKTIGSTLTSNAAGAQTQRAGDFFGPGGKIATQLQLASDNMKKYGNDIVNSANEFKKGINGLSADDLYKNREKSIPLIKQMAEAADMTPEQIEKELKFSSKRDFIDSIAHIDYVAESKNGSANILSGIYKKDKTSVTEEDFNKATGASNSNNSDTSDVKVNQDINIKIGNDSFNIGDKSQHSNIAKKYNVEGKKPQEAYNELKMTIEKSVGASGMKEKETMDILKSIEEKIESEFGKDVTGIDETSSGTNP